VQLLDVAGPVDVFVAADRLRRPGATYAVELVAHRASAVRTFAGVDLVAHRRLREVRVEPDRIFVRDGAVWTSAGVTAGMARSPWPSRGRS